MRRDLRLERIYPHAPSVVWKAISDPVALGEWLMPVFDFAPEVGREFTFRVKPQPGWDGIVHCTVLEVLPEQRLRFSWLGGGINTEVSLTLEPVADGTRLRLEHTGFDGIRAVLISTFLRGGWGKDDPRQAAARVGASRGRSIQRDGKRRSTVRRRSMHASSAV